ncbi:GPW/gp25 family protein [Aequorivita capsosiphonis]|uniref:GPW/gp25 family protein n=1 Tax=Aequorivita capsosiphonis TaxID=487317 RepID=UPI0003F63716|nr:GPW/gp25 family protein [Aequorivita capsosiphonis]
MAQKFYTLPLKPIAFTSNNEHKTCSIKDSIGAFLHLLATTYFGECTFDETFGNALWDVDFDNLTSNDRLRGIITDSIQDSINQYEKRLGGVDVEIKLTQETSSIRSNQTIARKRIDIYITGKIKQTNESFSYVESFYIAPISF